jgi:hypothetical protein
VPACCRLPVSDRKLFSLKEHVMSLSMFRRALCAAVVVCSWSALAQATLINIDMVTRGHNYTGSAVAGGGTWNEYDVPGTGGAAIPLVDANSAATAVTFSLSGYEGGDMLSDTFMGQYAYINPGGAAATFTLSGLGHSAQYALYLYGAAANNANCNTIFTANGVTQTTTGDGYYGSFVEGSNYVRLLVTANGSGTITGTFQPEPSTDSATYYGLFNGLQIESVPEPSTLMLLATGLLGLLAYAWRKRR